MNVEELLLNKRPNLGKSSVKTYASVLKSLHKAAFGNDAEIDVKNFDKQEIILKNLQSKEPTSRKTVLSGLVVLTDNDIYRSEML